ncbi:hypothetical protein Glove_168g311 [Diversispora epigaea]|uniref:Uncharacterized protein n=1 Tax=Diversispora epigaea TaxID=1348612 RepID=A0A397IZA5_9GLOM|nr:hypothetical protein Glove_168g311 [Diversispora epigaea]
MKIAKAKVGSRKVNCHLAPGFLGPSMCSDELLKKIGGKITRRISSKDKDSKFFREMTTHPIGWAVIPLTFTSNIKNNVRLGNKKSIIIPTEVLVEKYTPQLPNYILLGNNWFYGRKYYDDELWTYIPEIVTDAEDAWVRTTLCINNLIEGKGEMVIVSVDKRDIHDFYKILPGKSKDSLPRRSNISATSDSGTSDSDTSDSDSGNSSTSSSGIEVIHTHKTEAVRKRPILKRKVKGKVNY